MASESTKPEGAAAPATTAPEQKNDATKPALGEDDEFEDFPVDGKSIRERDALPAALGFFPPRCSRASRAMDREPPHRATNVEIKLLTLAIRLARQRDRGRRAGKRGRVEQAPVGGELGR